MDRRKERPVVFIRTEIKTPPLSQSARVETGVLLRRLQRGEQLSMPQSRPMPVIGPRCHELRIPEASANWRLIYRIDPDAIVVVALFDKKTRATPEQVITRSRRRLREYDELSLGKGE